jgi:hypothetical protein
MGLVKLKYERRFCRLGELIIWAFEGEGWIVLESNMLTCVW